MHILDYDLDQWRGWLENQNQPSYRAVQIMHWIYKQKCLNADDMRNIGSETKGLLKASFSNNLPNIISRHDSNDGTTKWLLQLSSGQHLETVYIPEKNRGTLCISSQVGCALACSFCATGLMGLNRNLKTNEIIAQVWLAMREIAPRRITNVVFMGMGEPLMNCPAVYPAINILLSDHGFGLSKYRVTVSTSGIVPAMLKLKEHSSCALAVSLHAPNNELRNKLVPINKKYPLELLIDACKNYTQGSEKRHIMLEYLLIKDVNDQQRHAKELIHIASQFRSKVNLIPYNTVMGIDYQASPEATVREFQKTLQLAGITTTVRKQRGDPIAAACGQLAGVTADNTRKTIREISET